MQEKGLSSPDHVTAKLKFANELKIVPTNFRTESISFYLDGSSWVHKSNLDSHEKIFPTRTWRKKIQGFKLSYCAKGIEEVFGRRVAKFMVAVSHSKGIVKYYQYKFLNFIEEQFPNMFVKEN